jgi:hypothetical protein
MLALLGTYENGRVTFDEDAYVPSKGKVIVAFLEVEVPPSKGMLKLSDFSFAKTRALLKDCKGSLSEPVVQERRGAV